MAHSIAAHRQTATQSLEADARSKLCDENLPVEPVATVAHGALHFDDFDTDILQGWAALVVGRRSSSSHSISNARGFIPERRLTTQSDIHMQGADEDKIIFNRGAHLRDLATILIPLIKSKRPLILGLDSCSFDRLDAAHDKEQIENNQVFTT
ncbi:hypothetical protein [Rhizobium sp. 21-4511-3d]